MRPLTLFILVAVLANASPADARLFRQTYGATIATDAGCTWNSNQDYFVPRYSSSGRYGLFSPCKTSHTTSPACRRCHALYPGYCSPYGPFHYCWRNHVYRVHCGCSGSCPYRNVGYRECRVPFRHGDGCRSYGQAMPAGCCQNYQPQVAVVGALGPLPNVEGPYLHVLGSIPIEGNGLLASVAAGSTSASPAQLLPTTPRQPVLPSLGRPQVQILAPPLLSP